MQRCERWDADERDGEWAARAIDDLSWSDSKRKKKLRKAFFTISFSDLRFYSRLFWIDRNVYRERMNGEKGDKRTGFSFRLMQVVSN